MEDVSETYKNLYHYTTISGALGIIKSKQLWATHCRFLNDTTERVHAVEAIYHHMYPQVVKTIRELVCKNSSAQSFFNQKGGIDKVAKEETKKIVDAQSDAAGNECYIVSLCGETSDEYTNKNGLLSQWRGYGKDGGAAIVFDTKKLEEHMREEGKSFSYSHFSLADLFYHDDFKDLNEDAQVKMLTIVNYGVGVIREIVLSEPNTVDTGDAYSSLASLVSRYKHRGFKEENEVRIIAWPIDQTSEYKKLAASKKENLLPEKARYFRETHGGLTPYIKLFETCSANLPIERIIIGPHKDKEKRKEALEIALRGYDIQIDVSEIPYVG